MTKVTVIELVNTNTKENLGYAPVIEEEGRKSKMILNGDKPMRFKTKKEAKDYGLEYIKV